MSNKKVVGQFEISVVGQFEVPANSASVLRLCLRVRTNVPQQSDRHGVMGTEVERQMATQVSVLYHRWSARCFQVMSLAEEILATSGMAQSSSPSELDRLETETRSLINESRQIGTSFDRSELQKIARDALEAAERLREVIERTPLPQNHSLRGAWEDFADHAEVFALSVDERVRADREAAVDEARRGESIPWERLREEAR